jgi:hypothetical protein
VIDHQALFDDVLAVVQTAHGATAGWRTICIRTQRAVGKDIIRPLSMLDLDDEVPPIAEKVRRLLDGAPKEIDTLVFGLFDQIDVDPRATERPDGRPRWEGADPAKTFTGFHLTGLEGFDPSLRWLPREPSWCPENRFLPSPALDAIARAAVGTRGDIQRSITFAMRFGAAALLSRFATDGLPYRVLVAFDEGDFAEVRGR